MMNMGEKERFDGIFNMASMVTWQRHHSMVGNLEERHGGNDEKMSMP